jgi:hypothetical protein
LYRMAVIVTHRKTSQTRHLAVGNDGDSTC